MKLYLSSVLMAALFTLTAPLSGQSQDQNLPRGGGHPSEDSPVSHEMEGIGRSFRKLTRQYAEAAQKSSTLDLVAEMQKHVATAKTLTPSKAEKLSGDERKKYLAAFHTDLEELTNELTALKTALQAGQNDKVKIEIEKIAKLKSTSHRELGVGGGSKDRAPGGLPSAAESSPAASPSPAQ